MVDEFTILRTLYGDVLVNPVAAAGGECLDLDMSRAPNGFFLGTSRVSAVVVETVNIGAEDNHSQLQGLPDCYDRSLSGGQELS